MGDSIWSSMSIRPPSRVPRRRHSHVHVPISRVGRELAGSRFVTHTTLLSLQCSGSESTCHQLTREG